MIVYFDISLERVQTPVLGGCRPQPRICASRRKTRPSHNLSGSLGASGVVNSGFYHLLQLKCPLPLVQIEQGSNLVVLPLFDISFDLFLVEPLSLKNIQDQLLSVFPIRHLRHFEVLSVTVHPGVGFDLFGFEPLGGWNHKYVPEQVFSQF